MVFQGRWSQSVVPTHPADHGFIFPSDFPGDLAGRDFPGDHHVQRRKTFACPRVGRVRGQMMQISDCLLPGWQVNMNHHKTPQSRFQQVQWRHFEVILQTPVFKLNVV